MVVSFANVRVIKIMFNIMRILDGEESGLVLSFQEIPCQYETGGDAARDVDRLRGELLSGMVSRIKYRIVPVKIDLSDDSWKQRERDKFNSAVYVPVPWARESWFLASEHAENHFPHISVNDPGKIAFTESDEKGAKDIQLRLRAGRYLKRYYSTQLAEHEIRLWSARVFLETGGFEIAFATTPDEIERVYLEGPHSCMAHTSDYYQTDGVHPVRVYGAGDLAVAYMKTGDDTISCRAISWPDKKIYGRIYGDGAEYNTKFKDALHDMGFEHGGECEFRGARILKIDNRPNDGFVCPYLDCHDSVSEGDDSNFLYIGGGEYCAQHEMGYCGDDENSDFCAMCEESYHAEEDGGFIEGSGSVCQSCYENYAFYCEECETTTHIDNAVAVDCDSITVCQSCAQDYPSCCECYDRFKIDNLMQTNDGDSVCESCLENYSTCDNCTELFKTEDMSDSVANHCQDCGDAKEEDEKESTSSPHVDDENQHELNV